MAFSRQTIEDVMGSTSRDFVSVSIEMSIPEAARLITQKGIGFLIVMDGDDEFAGVLSERDIIRIIGINPGDISEFVVGDLITRKVIACDPRAQPIEVIKYMNRKDFRHMPVVENPHHRRRHRTHLSRDRIQFGPLHRPRSADRQSHRRSRRQRC